MNGIIEQGIYKMYDDNNLICKITDLGENIYNIVNSFLDIKCEVTPIGEYRNLVRCIEHKRVDKNGHYRKTNKLLNHDMKWCVYVLEETGFIRKSKCTGK